MVKASRAAVAASMREMAERLAYLDDGAGFEDRATLDDGTWDEDDGTWDEDDAGTGGAESTADRLAFLAAASELAAAGADADGARRLSQDAGAALVRLAHRYDAAALRRALRPDPTARRVTCTVACYQIGDLTPSALRDFPDPVAAVTTLAECGEASHVAAELLASTADGLRWTALTRTGERVSFQAPPSGVTGYDPTAAADRWRVALSQWHDAERHPGPTRPQSSAGSTPAPLARGAHFRSRAREEGGTTVAVGFDMGFTLGQLLAAVRSVEATLTTADVAREQANRRLDAIEDRLQRLETQQWLTPPPAPPPAATFTEARVISAATPPPGPAPAAPVPPGTPGPATPEPLRGTPVAAGEMWAAVRLDAATVVHELLGRLLRRLGR